MACGARRAGRAVRSVNSVSSVRTIRTIRTIRAIRAIRAIGSVGAVGAVRSGLALGTFRPCGAARALWSPHTGSVPRDGQLTCPAARVTGDYA